MVHMRRATILWRGKKVGVPYYAILIASVLAGTGVLSLIVLSYFAASKYTTKLHLRYVTADATPIAEYYDADRDGYHFESFEYDSDHDGFFDTEVVLEGGTLVTRAVRKEYRMSARKLSDVKQDEDAKYLLPHQKVRERLTLGYLIQKSIRKR
jgi:hypothetical protein